MSIRSVNPANGQLVATYQEHTLAQIVARINAARTAQQASKRTPMVSRSQVIAQVAKVLRERKEPLARLMALEMGKPLEQGRAEVEKCASCCDYYAGHAAQFLAREAVVTEASASFIAYEPLGTVLAIMPWNFPLWQVIRAAAPALMAGNAVLLKHASNVFGCALAIEEVFAAAGLPQGLFAALLAGSGTVDSIIAHPFVSAVTLTGSTEAGRSVAASAGRCLKKCVLELGGSDPYLVLEDADLEAAATTCATSRLINSGQSCIAAKRFIVVRDVRQRFEELFVAGMRAKRVGDPLQPGTDVGPQARADLRDSLHGQVRRSVEQGASLLLGGELPDGPGAFYPCTVLSDVRPGMPAFDEETFGPVAAIIEAGDEKEAIDLANRTVFGLGAAVFTRDLRRGERIAAEELEAGCCFVNDYVRSDPRLPFGGVKDSGYGRELSWLGIREFVNIKTVFVK